MAWVTPRSNFHWHLVIWTLVLWLDALLGLYFLCSSKHGNHWSTVSSQKDLSGRSWSGILEVCDTQFLLFKISTPHPLCILVSFDVFNMVRNIRANDLNLSVGDPTSLMNLEENHSLGSQSLILFPRNSQLWPQGFGYHVSQIRGFSLAFKASVSDKTHETTNQILY